jgi:enamine deaminase RidA (YjgF/YER057c/UK114 family)
MTRTSKSVFTMTGRYRFAFLLTKPEIACPGRRDARRSEGMTLCFAFGDVGDDSKGRLGMGLPLLGGAPAEEVLDSAKAAGNLGAFSLWSAGAAVAGWARVDPGQDLEGAALRVYGDLFRAVGTRHLFRIWNCVPKINRENRQGLENYRAFCKGRSHAFEAAFGQGFARRLPASTAVGTQEDILTVAFLAGDQPVQHIENPAQIPAYEYPPEHGPRPPSFARASVVERDGRLDVFVSGTSAITGHATVAPHDTGGQLDRTLENLSLVFQTCGLGPGGARHIKVYLRRPGDFPSVSREIQSRLLGPGDRITYLCSDICRAALNVEIEVSVRGAMKS